MSARKNSPPTMDVTDIHRDITNCLSSVIHVKRDVNIQGNLLTIRKHTLIKEKFLAHGEAVQSGSLVRKLCGSIYKNIRLILGLEKSATLRKLSTPTATTHNMTRDFMGKVSKQGAGRSRSGHIKDLNTNKTVPSVML